MSKFKLGSGSLRKLIRGESVQVGDHSVCLAISPGDLYQCLWDEAAEAYNRWQDEVEDEAAEAGRQYDRGMSNEHESEDLL